MIDVHLVDIRCAWMNQQNFLIDFFRSLRKHILLISIMTIFILWKESDVKLSPIAT